MLIELLSTSNYVSYNIKLAQLLGLHTAIYLSELMNINDKAIRKEKVANNYFTIDRNYIKSRTLIDEKEQLEIEQNLLKLGILERGEQPDNLLLNITVLTTLMMSTDEQLIDNVKKLTKVKNRQTKATKDEKIKEAFKQSITTTNEELKEAYSDWIDAVYAKQGWFSKKAVILAQEVVDSFSGRNLDIALRLISIATINGYRDMEWAVNRYKEQYKVAYVAPPQEASRSVTLSSEVF